MTKIIILSFFMAVISLNSLGYSLPKDCPFKIYHRGNMQIYTQYQKSEGQCWISIQPKNAYQNLNYRSYLITSGGLLMVFNSYGPGEGADKTGAREFYFFPTSAWQNQIELNDKWVKVTLSPDISFTIETQDLYLLSSDKIAFKNFRDVVPSNQGGVEVVSSEIPFIDVGFGLGHSPSETKTSIAKLKNKLGQICQAPNSVLFDYKGDDTYLFNNVVLRRQIKQVCPQFIW